jgi:hypothetical protein
MGKPRRSTVSSTRRLWYIRSAWLVSALCIALLLSLIVAGAFEKETSILPKLGLLLTGVVAAAAGIVASDNQDLNREGVAALRRPRVIAVVVVAMLGAFGVLADALALFDPRPAVESTPGKIERDVAFLVNQSRPQNAAARIAGNLPGRWGEVGCGVVYQFTLTGQALVVEAIKRPVGAPPFRLVATVTAMTGDVLEARGESPSAARGQAVTFTYRNNGVLEGLSWDDQVGSVALELERCG